jgi:phosphopantothenoylcysteine decarboxylase
MNLDGVVGWINAKCPKLRVVAPMSKRLACGDVGVGAMAEVEEITATARSLLTPIA